MMTRRAETISRRTLLGAGASLLGLTELARPAMADAAAVRISRGFDLAELPLLVAEHERLIEKQAVARNLGQVAVQWLPPSTASVADSLTQGEVDVAAGIDLALFVAAWDERSGTPQEIRAIATLARMPYLLLSRDPAIATIRDFTAKDRIAVPVPKTSLPAVMLEMAAAQEWGPEHYDRLDAITVARPDPVAVAALHAGTGEINAHFTRLPYSDEERGDQTVHRIMDSFDIAGPHSVGALIATAQFRDANPLLCAAIAGALGEASQFIRHSPGAAAEMYVAATTPQDLTVEELTDMLADPDIAFDPAPAGMQRLAAFLHQIGRIKHSPDSWQPLFFPEIYKLPGS